MAKEVAIIGGGVVGLFAAWRAMRDGASVTVIDRGPDVLSSCASGSAGMIVPSHIVPLAAPGMVSMGLRMMWNPKSPFYIHPRLDPKLVQWGLEFMRASNQGQVDRAAPILRDLQLASRALFQSFAEETHNAFGLVERGLLVLCATEAGFEEEKETAAFSNAHGVEAQCLSAEETQAKDPGVQMSAVGSVYFPADCHLDPEKLLQILRQRLSAHGVRFVWDTEISDWETDSSGIQVVKSRDATFEADYFVLAGGTWSAGAAQRLDLRLPLVSGKGYSLTLKSPRELPTICSILKEARVAVTPMGETLRFGGTLELGASDLRIDPRRIAGIAESSLGFFPKFQSSDFETASAWAGFRPCSPDGLPYIGPHPRFRNLIVATGHAMMGLSLGPITGKLVAELIAERKPSVDLSALRPERFDKGYQRDER